jgi:hypothetical protein
MRAVTVVAVALATWSSLPLTAQREATSTAQQSGGTTNRTSPAQTTVQLRPVNGELMEKLDSKSAKIGDSVLVKTKESVKTEDGTEIPKGSMLVGTVTSVQPHGEAAQNSQIAIRFDHATFKSGQSVAIASVIQALAPAMNGAPSDTSSHGAPTAPSTAGGDRSMATPGTNMNPDTNHDAMNGNLGGNREGAQASLPPSEIAGASSASRGPAPGTIVAHSGNIAIRATGIPGVLLANNASGQPFTNASSIVLGAQRDVHLDGGTLIVIAVAIVSNVGAAGGMSH